VGLVEDKQTVIKHTPLHTKDWYIKWVSTIGLIIGMVFTANNIYPLNLYINIVALIGWIIVAVLWNDRALIILNTVGLSIYVNGVVSYLLK
jgi:energy-coupling factor transporter transmembrane protein EcfT